MDRQFGVISASGRMTPDGSLYARMTSDGFHLEFAISGDMSSLASLRVCAQQMPQLLTGIMQMILDEGEADADAVVELHERLMAVSNAESGEMTEDQFTELLAGAVEDFLNDVTKEEGK